MNRPGSLGSSVRVYSSHFCMAADHSGEFGSEGIRESPKWPPSSALSCQWMARSDLTFEHKKLLKESISRSQRPPRSSILFYSTRFEWNHISLILWLEFKSVLLEIRWVWVFKKTSNFLVWQISFKKQSWNFQIQETILFYLNSTENEKRK